MKTLKRKRTSERAKATRFITIINEFTNDNPLDDYEHYRGRLQETLDQMVRLDDSIQDLLEDRNTCSFGAIWMANRRCLSMASP